jgi:type I restriction enzyme, S subunit
MKDRKQNGPINISKREKQVTIPEIEGNNTSVPPQGWTLKPFREDVYLLSGRHVLSKDYNTKEDGVPYLTGPTDFPDGIIKETKFTTHPSTLCTKGDILVTVKGSGVGTIVKADKTYCISRQLMAVRVSKWNANFVYYSLLQNASKINDAANGVIPGLSRDDLLSQLLPIPNDKAEQRAIATALSDTDHLIESLEKLIAKKQDIKKATMQQLLTGKKRLPGFEGEWEVKRLGDVARFLKGYGLSKTDLSPDGKNKCIHYGELFTTYEEKIKRVVSRTNHNYTVLSKKNDVLMPTSDVTPNGLATASYIPYSKVILGGDILIIRTSEDMLNGEFLAYSIRMNRDKIMKLVSGTTVYHLYGKEMENFFFLAPSIQEQREIVNILSDMDNEIEALECRLEKTKQIKQGMMQELLTGKIRLNLQLSEPHDGSGQA